MIDPEKLKELSGIIAREISTSNKGLLSMFPISKYIEQIERYPKLSNYGYISLEVDKLCKSIVSKSGEQMLELYHQLTLVNLILIAQSKLEKKYLPQDIKNFYNSNFERITKEIEARDQLGSYNYAHDKFRKNLAVCSLKMIPAGAQKIHLSGISRRFLLKKGFSQFIKGINYVLFELGGFSPLYEMHTDSNDPELMKDFNEDGWFDFYRRISGLLKIQPEVKGVFGSSWFFDPQLEKITPRLAYLRRIPAANGGKIFYLGSGSQGIKDATLKSPTRRKLYQENKYMPTSYLLIWSRKKLISWADGEK